MADKMIEELPAAAALHDADLLVLQQGSVAKKMAGSVLSAYVNAEVDATKTEALAAIETARSDAVSTVTDLAAAAAASATSAAASASAAESAAETAAADAAETAAAEAAANVEELLSDQLEQARGFSAAASGSAEAASADADRAESAADALSGAVADVAQLRTDVDRIDSIVSAATIKNAEQDARIANLEAAANGVLYREERISSADGEITAPAGSLPYASLNSVTGWSEVEDNTIASLPIQGIQMSVYSKNRVKSVAVANNGSVDVNTGRCIRVVDGRFENGKTYTLTYRGYGALLYFRAGDNNNPNGTILKPSILVQTPRPGAIGFGNSDYIQVGANGQNNSIIYNITVTFTWTLPTQTAHIHLYRSSSNSWTGGVPEKVQIEYGSTPTTYTPYAAPVTYSMNSAASDDVLRSAGDVADMIDFTGSKLVRKTAYIPDLSALNWVVMTAGTPAVVQQRFYAVYGNVRASTRTAEILAPGYTCISDGSAYDSEWDMVIYNGTISGSGALLIHNHAAVDADGNPDVPTLKSLLSGVPAVVEIAQPTETPYDAGIPQYLAIEPMGVVRTKAPVARLPETDISFWIDTKEAIADG